MKKRLKNIIGNIEQGEMIIDVESIWLTAVLSVSRAKIEVL